MIQADQAAEMARQNRIHSFEAANPEFVQYVEEKINEQVRAGETGVTIELEIEKVPANTRSWLWANGFMVGEHIEGKVRELYISW